MGLKSICICSESLSPSPSLSHSSMMTLWVTSKVKYGLQQPTFLNPLVSWDLLAFKWVWMAAKVRRTDGVSRKPFTNPAAICFIIHTHTHLVFPRKWNEAFRYLELKNDEISCMKMNVKSHEIRFVYENGNCERLFAIVLPFSSP